jgi:hypothetical protein
MVRSHSRKPSDISLLNADQNSRGVKGQQKIFNCNLFGFVMNYVRSVCQFSIVIDITAGPSEVVD